MELTPSQFNRLHDLVFALFEKRLLQNGEKVPKTQNQRYGRGQYNSDAPNLSKDIHKKLNKSEHHTIYLGDRLYRLYYELNKPRVAKLDESDLMLLLNYLDCSSWEDFERKFGAIHEETLPEQEHQTFKINYYVFYYYRHPSIRKGLIIHNEMLRESEIKGDFFFPNKKWQVSWLNIGNNIICEMNELNTSPYVPHQKLFMLLYTGLGEQTEKSIYAGIILGVSNEGTPISSEILLHQVGSEEEAHRLLDVPPDSRIAMQLYGSEIRIESSIYQTIEDLPSNNVAQILQKMAGVYRTYFLEYSNQRLIQLKTTIGVDGVMEIEGPATNYKGSIKPVNGGGLLRARSLPSLESNPAYAFEFVMMNDFNSFSGVYTGVSSSHTPRAGRIINIKAAENEEVGYTFYEVGTEEYIQFLNQNPKIRTFFAGEKGDNYMDNFHSLSQDYMITHFYAACYLAKNSPDQALAQLKIAFTHGFKNLLLLKKETSEGGALVSLANYIDVEKGKLIEELGF